MFLLLVAEALIWFLCLEFHIARGDFASLYTAVRTCRTRTISSSGNIRSICFAIDIACLCYWKRVLCLQRSAATVCMLRWHGIPAQMVIGAKQLPFRSHAWAEVEGAVVNDKAYMREVYAVLDCC